MTFTPPVSRSAASVEPKKNSGNRPGGTPVPLPERQNPDTLFREVDDSGDCPVEEDRTQGRPRASAPGTN
jgi:hypothetical protein